MTAIFIVVSYDITDDARRRKVMKAVKDYGTRVQYSVFECRLPPNQIKKLQGRLKPLIDNSQDSIRFYFLDADAVQRIEVMGVGMVTPVRTTAIH